MQSQILRNMKKKINTIEDFKAYFEKKTTITLQDIKKYYHAKDPKIPDTTVNWKVYNFVQLGILQRIGKGLYQLGETQKFVPQTNNKMYKIESLMQKNFPFVRYCQWDLSLINTFAQHLINFNVLLIDVEKDAVDSVYQTLKEIFSKVMVIQNLYDDLSEFNNYILVRPLITEAPIQTIEKIHAATLEKMLVDLAVDKEFSTFQGNEFFRIFRSACEQYTINRNTLLRYATRKNRKNEIQRIITINRQ